MEQDQFRAIREEAERAGEYRQMVLHIQDRLDELVQLVRERGGLVERHGALDGRVTRLEDRARIQNLILYAALGVIGAQIGWAVLYLMRQQVG